MYKRQGLKFVALIDLCKKLGVPTYFWHQYTMEPAKKVVLMQSMLGDGYTETNGQKVQGWGLL